MFDLTIEQFLDQGVWRSAYLEEPEWKHLYVRKGHLRVFFDRRLERTAYFDQSVHLANFEAAKPRTGAFTRIVERIEAHSPNLPIFVENLFDTEFGDKLLKRGFVEVWTGFPHASWSPRCFLKASKESDE